jgi:hypothetical protein
VGRADGGNVGGSDGTAVGSAVGGSVGWCVGIAIGFRVGDCVGSGEGASVGASVIPVTLRRPCDRAAAGAHRVHRIKSVTTASARPHRRAGVAGFILEPSISPLEPVVIMVEAQRCTRY